MDYLDQLAALSPEVRKRLFDRLEARETAFSERDRSMRSNRGPRSDPAAEVRHMGGHRHGVTWFGQPPSPRVTDDADPGYEETGSLLHLYATGGKATRFHRRKNGTWDVRKRSVDGLLTEFLANWHIEEAGATGGALGKHRKGVTRPDLIEAAVVSAGWSRRRIRRLLDRGKPSAQAGLRRVELAKAVAGLLARPRPLNVAAFANWIGCNPSTLYALRIRGEKLIQAATPRTIRGLPWCFTPSGVLVCSRGHLTYSPEPAAWIGHKCGHDHTCGELLQLAQDPNSNVIPLRGEAQQMQTIPTDDQLALDVERLVEASQELLAMAARFQIRFPASRVLSETVDRFLEAAQASGSVADDKRAA